MGADVEVEVVVLFLVFMSFVCDRGTKRMRRDRGLLSRK